MSTTTAVGILTEDEMRRLVMACAHEKPDGFTERDVRAVVDWAQRTRIDAHLLESVLDGDFIVWPDPDSGEMQFALSAQGKSKVEAMRREVPHA